MKLLPYIILLILVFSVNAEANIDEDKAIKIVQKLYASDIEGAESMIPSSEKVEIEITLLDLNNDKYNEILVRLLHSALCGSRGCQTMLLKRTAKNGWVTILDGIITHGDIDVHKEIFNNHRIINFGDGPILRFDNDNYVF